MKIERFEDIESWKEGRKLTNGIYDLTVESPFSRDYGLVDQVRRASVSIMANIAEGFDAGSNKAFVNFLSFAYRSASEVQSLLYVALDRDYIGKSHFDANHEQAALTKRLIGGFMKYLRKSGNRQ